MALALKGLEARTRFTYIHLLEGDHHGNSYTCLNPSHSVPTLEIIPAASDAEPVVISQSIAALEYLDEAYLETYQLLPGRHQPRECAVVRTLCEIIASDTQPVVNLKILQRVNDLTDGDIRAAENWQQELMMDGFRAYEEVCKGHAGRYSVGDEITMADVCLVPAVWKGMRFGVDVEAFPTMKKVYDEMEKSEAVKWAHWKNQKDTPKGLRSV